MNDHFSESEQIEAMSASLSLSPDALPVSALMPIFVPASFFQRGNWPGPYESMQIPGLGLTWAFEQPAQTMLYLSNKVASHLNAQHRGWRADAEGNLRLRSKAGICSGVFRRGDDKDAPYYALVFMHSDGFGPSRLLLNRELEGLFPAGYQIGLPEMSCGLALSNDAAPDERAKIEDVIDGCYRGGSRPLVPGLHDPRLLQRARGDAERLHPTARASRSVTRRG